MEHLVREPIANRVMRGMLRSRLHGVLSSRLLLVTYRGRRSKELHTFPAMYVRDGARVIVVAGHADHKLWWRQMLGGAEVMLRISGQEIPAHATPLLEPTRMRGALLRRYLERFPSVGHAFGLQHPLAELEDDALGRCARDAVVVEFRLSEALVAELSLGHATA